MRWACLWQLDCVARLHVKGGCWISAGLGVRELPDSLLHCQALWPQDRPLWTGLQIRSHQKNWPNALFNQPRKPSASMEDAAVPVHTRCFFHSCHMNTASFLKNFTSVTRNGFKQYIRVFYYGFVWFLSLGLFVILCVFCLRANMSVFSFPTILLKSNLADFFFFFFFRNGSQPIPQKWD